VEKKGVIDRLIVVLTDTQWIERVSRCGSDVGLFLCGRVGLEGQREEENRDSCGRYEGWTAGR
jgi:hypothetical protein